MISLKSLQPCVENEDGEEDEKSEIWYFSQKNAGAVVIVWKSTTIYTFCSEADQWGGDTSQMWQLETNWVWVDLS